MTVKGKTIYNKTVGLSPQLYARWLAYHAEEAVSFNGLVTAFLEEKLPHLKDEEEARP